MEIRKAKKNDIGNLAELMYSSGADIYDFVYKTDNKTAIDYIRYEYKTGKGFCGYKNVTVGVKDGDIVGTGCFYDGKVYGKLVLGTIINIFIFYGAFKFRKIVERSKHTSSVMKRPRENELYLSNFGVNEKNRSQGVGSAMLEKMINQAKKAGYKKFILDVSEANPRAQMLYLKHGLMVAKIKTFSGKKVGVAYATTKQMELELKN